MIEKKRNMRTEKASTVNVCIRARTTDQFTIDNITSDEAAAARGLHR